MILGTMRRKIIANFGVILLIVASAMLFTGLASSELARSVELLFRNNLLMERIRGSLDSTEADLQGYLTNKNSDALKGYIQHSTELAEMARKLNREARQDEALLLQKDLAGLIDGYLQDAEASVSAKRGRNVQGYSERYASAEQTAELARVLIVRIEGIYMSDSLRAFSEFRAHISAVLASNTALVITATLMGIMLLLRFSYKVTEPLAKLAEAARAVGRGEYDHALPLPGTGDEVGTTAEAFSSMQRSVRQAFEEIRAKSEVEKNLMEERMRVLDMSHKLKAAELLALQTQINPHFLFNTLSAGMQLALAESADRTADFLENLSAFIRYVLKPPSRSVWVSDELECLERYLWLLKLRFGDRYAFEVSADDDVLSVETPALLLQPLVENAVAHGLKDKEEGGRVRVTARRHGDEAVLSVEDTGDGMTQEEIQKVLGEDEHVHECGIGLRNVIRRVVLATGGKGRVELESVIGKGTNVRIHLPAGGSAP
ncbi:MAG TPA: histidine kinase [Holophaga sp.]|nr:histidine kinase [Holophaga sp.]